MIKLPPTEFPFGKYDGQTIPNHIYMAVHYGEVKDAIKWLKNQNIIGYIDGMELEIRPRTDTYGILIEDEEGFVSWAHIPNDIFEKFLRDNNDRKTD